MPKGEGKLIAQNKKARHDYSIIDTMEAGMVLQGTEIKSIRNSRINLKDGFVRVRNGEAYMHNVHISPYEQGNIFNHDPLRTRKLLLQKYWGHDRTVESILTQWIRKSPHWACEREKIV